MSRTGPSRTAARIAAVRELSTTERRVLAVLRRWHPRGLPAPALRAYAGLTSLEAVRAYVWRIGLKRPGAIVSTRRGPGRAYRLGERALGGERL